jgi:arabinogalactan oligomer/maltooligosaccharide transport system permease protein
MESETKKRPEAKETSPAMAAPALAVTAAPGGHYVGTSSLEYLSMGKGEKIAYRFSHFFTGLPRHIWNFLKAIPLWIWGLMKGVGHFFVSLFEMFRFGDWKTRLSFLLFGFGNLTHKQIGRGLLLFLYEVGFIAYMVLFGGKYISKFGSLGTVVTQTTETGRKIVGDNSFQILLYSVATFAIIIFTAILWYKSVRMAYENQENASLAKRLPTFAGDVKASMNANFHTTLLSVPLTTLILFTVIPLFFMIFVAFTNYDGNHMPPNNLFTWVGNENFSSLLNGSGLAGNTANWSYTFWNVLWWTLLWAVLATFSNFFLGMVIAMIINKKGLKLKKLWRTLLVVVIAVPQFISLMLMSKMLTTDGAFNILLEEMGILNASHPIEWLLDPWMARLSVVLVNLWIGIPYTVLSCTGILMNIPEDLYEAARIDGASPYQMYRKITLPYMMFVMGPSLITTFVGNLNNFNVIYLLTGGTTGYPDSRMASCYAGQTDLLITWLYKLTVNNQYYGIASVIGILVFIITAFFSLVVYGNIGSVKNEEEFQ